MATKPWSHLKAPRRLRDWRTKTLKGTQREASELLGIHPTKYSAFESMRTRPSLDVAAHIENVTNGAVLTTWWAQAFDLDERRSSRAA